MAESGTVDEMPRKQPNPPGKPTTYDNPEERRRVHQAVLTLRKRFDSGSAMAEALGVSQPTVSTWLSGQVLPTMPHLKKIAKMLGTTEAAIRSDIAASSVGIGALDVAWRYEEGTGRWPSWALDAAKALERNGETHHPQGWTKRLDEIRDGMTPRGSKR